MELVTDRVRIDALTRADAAALFAYRRHPDVTRFQAWCPEAVADAHAFLAANATVRWGDPDAWLQLAVRSRETGALVGDLGVHFLPGDGSQLELGFTIDPAHQRQGYGLAAVRALLDHAFTTRDTHRVTASVDPENAASLALLRRVGMRQEAHFRQSLLWRGEWVDDLVFALLRAEWPHDLGR
ncbi:MAG: GNAT family protein [Planctomycetota bacterium]